VDDDVVRIDEHPVAMRQALDPRGREPGLLAGLDDAIGNCANVNVGATACDYHHVSEGCFAVQIDGNDVFGFRIVETCQDVPHE
jgi:hypothetical protein